jgi:uncharacterized coiled-coil protein SlyX
MSWNTALLLNNLFAQIKLMPQNPATANQNMNTFNISNAGVITCVTLNATNITGSVVASQVVATASNTNSSFFVPFVSTVGTAATVFTSGTLPLTYNAGTGLLSTNLINATSTITTGGGITDNSAGSTFGKVTAGLITNSIVQLLALSVSSSFGNLSFQLINPAATSIPIGTVIAISGTTNALFNGISVTVTGYVGSFNVDTTNPTAIPNGQTASGGQLAYGSMTSGAIVTPKIDNGSSTLTVGSATSGVNIAVVGGTGGNGNIPFITNTSSTTGTFAIHTDSAQHFTYSAATNALAVGGPTNGSITLNGTASILRANGSGATALSVPNGTASLPTITNSGLINNAKLNYNSTFGTLYLGRVFPVGLAGAANYNTFIGEGSATDNTTGSNNTIMGFNAGFYNRTGVRNTCIGDGAGAGVSTFSSSDNTFIGQYSGLLAVGGENVCVGQGAGYGALSGASTYTQNVIVGKGAGSSLTTASGCTFVGFQSGPSVTTGGANTIVGKEAGFSLTTGTDNVYLGLNAGFRNATGAFNTYIGIAAGQGQVGGNNSENTAVGKYALLNITSGYTNSVLGSSALTSVTSGFNNVAIGTAAGVGSTPMVTGSNNTYLGMNAFSSSSGGDNEIVIGATVGNGSNTCTIRVFNSGFYLTNYSAGTLTVGSAGQVVSVSDIRVKSNIVYLPTAGSTDTIMGLKPASFDLQFDPYKRYTGFIADDVQLVIPGCVDGKKHKFQWETDDEVDVSGNIIKHGKKPKVDANGDVIYKKDENGQLIPRHLGMDYNEITSRLVLAFQEQVGIISKLETTVASQEPIISKLETTVASQETTISLLKTQLDALNAHLTTLTMVVNSLTAK